MLIFQFLKKLNEFTEVNLFLESILIMTVVSWLVGWLVGWLVYFISQLKELDRRKIIFSHTVNFVMKYSRNKLTSVN